MVLPFSAAQFYGVFRGYNEAVWPAQWLLTALAGTAVICVAARVRAADRIASAVLAALWAWIGIAYHVAFFSAINPLAYPFAALTLAGAAAFLWHGVVKGRLAFAFGRSLRTAVAALLILFALVGYPAWSIANGRPYPQLPTFGLPCPTTLFTIGLLALAVPPYPRTVFIAPIAWSLIGAQAALLLDVAQDLALLAAAAIGIVLMVRNGNAHVPFDRPGIPRVG